ncbi:hypothetical protein CNYM01_10609 [Colletotrichum nymphaeae SA-01]|uniref:Uncharacterized protein n=1 Tax=Colletotrichum nymphaeae SA-01 TaxID=1460502 RepID=A0A135RYP4_9PEZI|nr:hypothetical protein CNYM01_10609 [Colletotrichum nymphaeae SA-01]
MSQSFKDFVRRNIRTTFKIFGGNQGGSVSHCVEWEDIEPASFVDLMEYACSGDYAVPALSKSKTDDTSNAVKGGHSSHDTPGTERDGGDVGVNTPASTRPSTAKRLVPPRLGMGATRTRRNAPQPEISSLYTWIRNVSQDPQCQQHTSAQYKFCEEYFPIPLEATESTAEEWLEDIKLQHQTGYKEVFLAHAKLYLVANQFEIVELKDFACTSFARVCCMPQAPTRCCEPRPIRLGTFIRTPYPEMMISENCFCNSVSPIWSG